MAGTAKVLGGSALKRQQWLRDGLLENVSHSFWNTYTGNSSDAIVYQENDTSADTGHTVVFDFTGKLTGKAILGEDQAYGKGEIKRKFSDKITVQDFTIPVNNGRAFDGVDIGDLSITQHSDSRAKLADLFVRVKDQYLFDVAQGAIGAEPTHIINLGTTFTYNSLLDIEDAAKTGKGMYAPDSNGVVSTTAAKRRAPLAKFKSEGGANTWLCIIDNYMARSLKADNNYQTIVINADIRGNNNRSIEFMIGKLGNVIYVEAGDFFGITSGKGTFTYDATEVEFAGLRKYGVLADGSKVWEGQAEYSDAVTYYSRGLLLGGGAIQSAFGKMPDYLFQSDDNFGRSSESAMEFWAEFKKTNLKVEAGEDYKAASVADLDYSIIAIDLEH